MKPIAIAAAPALLLFAGAAQAQDKQPCVIDMVCASNPDSVVAALKAAELEPRLARDNGGDPIIEVESGYRYDVAFYGCTEGRDCDSLRFQVLFRKGPENTAELANKWNSSKRFVQMSVRADGMLAATYDVPTIGGLNKRNFADVLDWWDTMLDELSDFFRTNMKQVEAEKPAA